MPACLVACRAPCAHKLSIEYMFAEAWHLIRRDVELSYDADEEGSVAVHVELCDGGASLGSIALSGAKLGTRFL